MATLRRRGVTVLTHDAGVRTIEGIAMAGFEDPLMLGGREFPDGIRAGLSFGDIPRGHERFLEAVEQRWTWWHSCPSARTSSSSTRRRSAARSGPDPGGRPRGAPLMILTGHTHRQRMDRYGPVTVIDAGSIGAGGLFGIGSQDVGPAMLDVRRDDHARRGRGGSRKCSDLGAVTITMLRRIRTRRTTMPSTSVDPQVLRAFLDAFNVHDLDAVMDFFAEDCVLEMPRGPAPGGRRLVGKEQVREGIRSRLEGIPDIHYGDDRDWTCGDRGGSEWTIRGTQVDGEGIEVRGCDLLDFTDGRTSRKDSF